MSNDLISRKNVLNVLESIFDEYRMAWGSEYGGFGGNVKEAIEKIPVAFDPDKVITELEAWAKASRNEGVRCAYAGIDNKASEYYQESRAYTRAAEIVKKGGIE